VKRGFEDNVPKVRPRVRLGRALEMGFVNDEPAPRDEPEPRNEPPPHDEPDARRGGGSRPDRAAAEDQGSAREEVEEAPRETSRFEGVTEANEPPIPAPETREPRARPRQPELLEAALARAEEAGTAREAKPRARKSQAATQVTALAKELTFELNQAAEANARLKADLDAAVTALRRAAEEARDERDERERLVAEDARHKACAQELSAELELLEAERDGALAQSARTARELREARARESAKAAEASRAAAEAQEARETARRLAAELQARLEERDAARAERDELSEALLAARAESDDAVESRNALEEVHRALNEARTRIGRIR
jgi:hypothetical protein